MILKRFLLFVAAAVFFTSCTDDTLENKEVPLGVYDNGLFIINQGNFGRDNSSISYLSDDFLTFQKDAYLAVNPTKILGDTALDMGFYENLAFIVVNNSHKIEVVNRYTLEHVATIDTGLSNPRYITFVNGKGYVTNWGDGNITTDDYVAVIDLSNYTVSSTISVAEGPERIIENNGDLYVVHQGAFNFGNSISVLNPLNNTIKKTILVGDRPNFIQIKDESLYVLCEGKPSYASTETAGKLVKINLASNTVSSAIDFPAQTHPSNLAIEDNNIFYTQNTGVFKMDLSATTLPTSPFFSASDQGALGIYSFAVENGKFYVADAVDYNSDGSLYIYNSTGALENEFKVGINPGGFYFN